MSQQKYTDGSGVAEIWANTKNYVASQLLNKSEVGHTHSYNDLTDKPVIPNVSNYYTKAEVDALISNAGISPSTNTLFIGEPYSLANSAETNLGNYEEVSND
jgi:hypothetical protein